MRATCNTYSDISLLSAKIFAFICCISGDYCYISRDITEFSNKLILNWPNIR